MTHDEVRALAPEYVLNALDPAVHAEVARHMTGCDSCRALVADESRVLDALGRGVPQSAPPAALRDRVLREAQAAAPANVRPLARPARRFYPWLAAAAAMVLLAAGAVQLARSNAERNRSLAIVAAADLVRFELTGDAAPARARAFWSHRHGMVFTAEGLRPLPQGRTYQLWVISRGTPISAGVFEAGADGQARVVMETPLSLTQVDAVAVTIEPDGGRHAPSTAPILAGAPLD